MSKKVSYRSSIVNQNSGGGPKKAGLAYQIGRSTSTYIAFHQISQTLVVLRGLKYEKKVYLDGAIRVYDAASTRYNDALIVKNAAQLVVDNAGENVTPDESAALAAANTALAAANTVLADANAAKIAAQAAYDAVA